jgi:hypothetical protein
LELWVRGPKENILQTMKNIDLESACEVRVDIINLGLISMELTSKRKSHDRELVYQAKNPEENVRSSWLSLGKCL